MKPDFQSKSVQKKDFDGIELIIYDRINCQIKSVVYYYARFLG